MHQIFAKSTAFLSFLLDSGEINQPILLKTWTIFDLFARSQFEKDFQACYIYSNVNLETTFF